MRRIQAGRPPPGVDYCTMEEGRQPPKWYDELEVEGEAHEHDSVAFMQYDQPRKRKKNLEQRAEQPPQHPLPNERTVGAVQVGGATSSSAGPVATALPATPEELDESIVQALGDELALPVLDSNE